MKWKKLGCLFNVCNLSPKLLSHASNPLALHLKANVFRVFYSGRDCSNKSSVGFVDLDVCLRRVVSVCDTPIAGFGTPGSYYSHGISVGCSIELGEKHQLLFMGWQIPDGEHWFGEIGSLSLSSEMNAAEVEPLALMTRDDEDPISLSYPWVIYDGGSYKMWYGSTVSWETKNGEMLHVIKYATSKDGNNWKRQGIAIPYEIGVAQAFSRPTVIKQRSGYHMWFSYRSGSGTKYRIGYAFSYDGVVWERKYKSGIDVSDDGWDSEMVCYPFVFEHKGEIYMLYNGNGYGESGFGLAVLQE